MKRSHIIIPTESNKLISLGVLLSVLSWLVESFVHSQIFYEQKLNFVSHIFFPDAHELWMRVTIVFLFLSFALYAQYLVKALREAEKKVKEINTELTQIFNTSADGMRVIDPTFSIVRVNDTFLKLTGERAEDVLHAKCYDIFRGANCHTDACPMKKILNGAERVEYDSDKISRNNRATPCIVTATPFHDANGTLAGIVENFKDISERKRNEKQLQQSHKQLRSLTCHLEKVREHERQGLARELHDELGQALTGMQMDIAWISRHIEQERRDFHEKLSSMDQQLSQLLQIVQRISADLRPRLLDDLGLFAAMEWHASTIRDRLGIAIDILSIPEEIMLDNACRIIVYRIFQEALTNIVRHAEATQVEILLIREEDVVTLTIRDNGRGISREQIHSPQSLGLCGMRERAALLHGALIIEQNAKRGTTIYLSIPSQHCMRTQRDKNTDH
ncbi:PAS domain-containing sensor histidine kinase [Desulfogranum japonicum]|uniref:PAS domain-containing sensor histidine kinase n=1 Tax=Desulfogranum japonicum TaxID=231447 RepID=UPI00041C3620|nr:PAS domain-containing protein [Desulfogranum japonicum]